MDEIYLDNSATTRTSDSAAAKAVQIMTQIYGNPSSLHSKGMQAEQELKAARETIAASLGASAGEIYFTSGGTESNNTAVFGAAGALKRRGNRIVTTAIEHSSVLESMHSLEKEGFNVVYLEPDKNGRIKAENIVSAVTPDTILVSIMLVNNETGAIQPVEAAAAAIRRSKSPALLHVDAVQAYMKLPVSAAKLKADLISVSGHKIHAPKGVGALYVRRGVRIIPLHCGGEQQGKLRPGTEPMPLICAMAEAVKDYPGSAGHDGYIHELNVRCRSRLKQLEGVIINSDETCLDHIINFSVPGIRSETMLHYLESYGIYVSSGSACAKGHKSHVLTAMGLDRTLIDSAIRVSFSHENTVENIDFFANQLETGLHTLARSK